MKEAKRNKIIAALVVNAVLFVFILIAVVIAQIACIWSGTNTKADLQAEYNLLVEKRDNAIEIEERLEADEELEQWLLKYVNENGKLPDWVVSE
ncbi:MAG: hypothetical protein ACI4MN_00365 [Candidatus Coproplasma sp.]